MESLLLFEAYKVNVGSCLTDKNSSLVGLFDGNFVSSSPSLFVSIDMS